MSSLFCRHNRMTARCPICSKELEAELRAKAPPRPASARPARAAGAGAGASAARRSSAARSRTGGVVTRRLARAQDDGYRNPLVPGLRATADAERLAGCLVAAAARLAPPGPYEVVTTEPDRDQATWLAFLLALAGPDAPELQDALAAAAPRWEDRVGDAPPGLPAEAVASFRGWVARAGSPSAALLGEPDWSPQRRFARTFERLALPGLTRAVRYELLAVLGAAGLYPLQADTLGLGAGDDPTVLAAKRVLLSGDTMLLERRARELAATGDVPLAALDRGLAVWGAPGAPVEAPAELPAALRSALALR